MRSGCIFDIRDFAVHDGPGIRTTVFLKGCPLRCSWCHNPEGQSPLPQTMHAPAGDRVVGREYTSAELAALLNRQADILRANEGGVTFSGGEPLMQAEFVAEVCDLLPDVHIILDTSGHAPPEAFCLLAEKCNLFYYDLKIMDPQLHRQFTGVDNQLILANLRLLGELNVPFVIRVALVPGVTDTDENLAAIADIAQTLPRVLRVDLLPYNRVAGGKYRGLGMEFRPHYDEGREIDPNTKPFERLHIPVHFLGMKNGC
jgi:pyruvate formate lyase activating enzyme